jgi:MvaI/BcnI restriction endonuclease family
MADAQPIYTKELLIDKFREIAAAGWIANARHGNAGGIGNTLEDLLGIRENNLPIPNAAEWELKTQAIHTTSLTTLFHVEPSPRALKFVTQVLLPKYGWAHQEDGKRYPAGELSFRQTINGQIRTDRGFMVIVDRRARKVLVSFNAASVSDRHHDWLRSVEQRVGLQELDPQPYWGFDDLMHKAGTKLPNTFYVQAAVRRDGDWVFYKYEKVTMLQQFSFSGFLDALEIGKVLVDFDARSGHNHGTKFWLRQDCLPMLYKDQNVVVH